MGYRPFHALRPQTMPGYPLEVACPRCGANAPAESRFCPACGAELASLTPREERKLVSILFCDQVGSTARADGADPEDVRDLNRVYYEEARAHIVSSAGWSRSLPATR